MTREEMVALVKVDRLIRALDPGATKTAFQAAFEEVLTTHANNELSQVTRWDRAGVLDVRSGPWVALA